MPSGSSNPKTRNAQPLAQQMPDCVAPDPEPLVTVKEKNPAAVVLGRLGRLKGGQARAAKLSVEERQEIAKKAARARWKKPRPRS